MSMIRVAGFLGENRAIHPMMLPETVGVTSLNCKPGRGDMRPWKAPATVATVPAGRQTIYRMGRDVVSDADYWLSWPQTVHVVVGGNADDTSERTYYTGSGADGLPRWTDNTKALPVGPDSNAGARLLGVPAPASPLLLSATNPEPDPDSAPPSPEDRFYTYTYVSDIGEEGAPNPNPTRVTCDPLATVTISNMATPPSGNYGVNRIRIYRTQLGGSGTADFFFLREIASTATSTTDDNRDLGEVMVSTTWLPPDPGMTWLTGLWNGMMCGIVGRAIRFCEAYTYYAWPIAYEILPTNAQPVALATFGQTLVMLTNGNPSIIAGGTPDAMDEQPMEFAQACVAPLSAVGVGHGVVWASPDGLCYVGQGGARVLTQGVMTRDDWQALNPASIKGVFYEGRYFGFYNDGTAKAFIFDFADATALRFLDFGADAVYLDELQDALFVLQGTSVKKFDAGTLLSATFKSKLFKMPKPVQAFSCAQVTADSYPVTFKLYADGNLKHTQSVANVNPFRLPAGYYADTYQIELSGTGAIQLAAVAHSMTELAGT